MKTFTHVSVTIENDPHAGNPRDEHDQLSTFHGVINNRWVIGGKNDTVYTSHDNMTNIVQGMKQAGAVVLPFFSKAGDQYAVIDKDTIVKEYGNNKKLSRDKAYALAQCEINEYRAWCDGKVYGYIIKDRDGETLDSCWGFYGMKYCEQEAESAANLYENEKEKEQREIMTRLDHMQI